MVVLGACGQSAATGEGAGSDGGKKQEAAQQTEAGQGSSSVEEQSNEDNITVITTYAGEDVNAGNFKEAFEGWEKETGYEAVDESINSSELFKEMIQDDFEAGKEPDVLFFFTGADSESFIKEGKVMSVDEIRKDYPDYASNMDEDRMPASAVDGKYYAVPVNGYWEGLYYNEDILEAAGVEKPGKDYDMEQFMADCEKIKAAGYIPIAASLGEVPHYWWEYMIFNYQTPKTHDLIPKSADDKIGKQWVKGLGDVKKLYEKGYYPSDTLSISNMDTVDLFEQGKAAFLVDGSWRLGSVVSSCLKDEDDPTSIDKKELSKYNVAYVPGNGKRKATDVVGGMSMGYYISRKAYEDPDKRDAAVSFVEYMTSNEIVNKFASHTTTALKNQKRRDTDSLNSLQKKAIKMMEGATSMTPALQDLYLGDCRKSTFEGMPELVTGNRDIKEAVQEGLDIYYSTK